VLLTRRILLLIMKKILFAAFLFVFANSAFAQAEVTNEGGTKVIKGFMTRQELSEDAAFPWFASNQKGYVPYPAAVTALKAAKDSIHILAFGGTWCDDTKAIFPKFFALADSAGLTPDRITILGVDHNKKTTNHLSEAFNVTLVPTFIVLKNGKEIGRVVEWGKYGMFDKELGEIIKGK